MKSKVWISTANDETIVFTVQSSSRKKGETHDVYFDVDNGWVCTCEQFYYRKKYCKHMKMAKEYFNNINRKMENAQAFRL